MSLIKATTPTSQGFAQAFDLSGFVEYNNAMARDTEEKDLARREKLAKDMMTYDPKGIMPNHLNLYGEMFKEYQEFVGDNQNAILNPGANMEIYQEKLAKENELKTFASGSIQMNQDYHRALPVSLQNESFINPENSLFMEGLRKEGTREMWESGTLMQPVMEGLGRNYMVDEQKIVDKLKSSYVKDVGGMDRDSDPDFYLKSITEQLSSPQAEKYLRSLYEAKNVDGGDLNYRFKTFEEFSQGMIDRVVTETSTSYTKKPEVDVEEAGQEKWDIAFQPLNDPYSFSAGATSVIDEEIWSTYDEEERAKATKNDEIPMIDSTKAYQLRQSHSYAPNTQAGGGTAITIDIDEAFNTTTGKSEDIPKSVNKMKVMQVGRFNIATKTVSLPRHNQTDLVITAGNPIPKMDEENFKMTTEDYEDMLASKTEEKEMAKVFASTNALDLIEHMSIEEIMELVSKEGTTNKMLLVDYSLVHETLAGNFDRAVDRAGAYQEERSNYLYGDQKTY